MAHPKSINLQNTCIQVLVMRNEIYTFVRYEEFEETEIVEERDIDTRYNTLGK